jgi:hypothetical protein
LLPDSLSAKKSEKLAPPNKNSPRLASINRREKSLEPEHPSNRQDWNRHAHCFAWPLFFFVGQVSSSFFIILPPPSQSSNGPSSKPPIYPSVWIF